MVMKRLLGLFASTLVVTGASAQFYPGGRHYYDPRANRSLTVERSPVSTTVKVNDANQYLKNESPVSVIILPVSLNIETTNIKLPDNYTATDFTNQLSFMQDSLQVGLLRSLCNYKPESDSTQPNANIKFMATDSLNLPSPGELSFYIRTEVQIEVRDVSKEVIARVLSNDRTPNEIPLLKSYIVEIKVFTSPSSLAPIWESSTQFTENYDKKYSPTWTRPSGFFYKVVASLWDKEFPFFLHRR